MCNIRERAQVEALCDEVLRRFGRIDFLVNNGGGQFPADAENYTEKGWKAVIDTNLTGTWTMCQIGRAALDVRARRQDREHRRQHVARLSRA